MANNFIQSAAVIVDAYLVSDKHGGRIIYQKFNMADSVKKTPSLACFRQLDCVFQYSYTSLSILQFHSQFFFDFAFSQLPVVVCDYTLLVMSNCHDFN